MKFYKVEIEATVEGESKIGARNSLIFDVLGLQGVLSAGLTKADIKKSKAKRKTK